MTPACKREFEKFLDEFIPNWRWRDRPDAFKLFIPFFEAGWKAGRQSVHKQRAAMQRKFGASQ